MAAESELIFSKIIFLANVFDNQDPLMLGRVRASGQTQNVQDVYNGIPDWNPQTDPWTTRDPFVYTPLLPIFFSQVPKVEELIQIIYSNPKIQFEDQFYIQGPFSSPLLMNFEFNEGANSNLGTGIQYQKYPPIKNNDGTYKDNKSKGIFPEPGDNALLGRGSADLIVKQNEVLLRAGKTLNTNPLELPAAYNKRSFIQLSQFKSTKQQTGFSKYTKLNEIIQKVNFLIEYLIYNPENQQGVFTGEINIYTFTETVLTNDDFSLTKDYNSKTTLKETIKLGPGSMSSIVSVINGTLQSYNNDTSTPFFFRPGLTNSKYITTTSASASDDIEQTNISELYTNVKPDRSANITGSGLVFWKNAYGQQYSPEKIVEPVVEYIQNPVSYSIMGGDNIYLIANSATTPGKPVINLDGTLYGISQEKLVDEILNSTSSSVRGEELLQLLSLIVKFLVGHSHAYHGLPPVPIASNGSNVPDILKEIQLGYQKILNSNIRIN